MNNCYFHTTSLYTSKVSFAVFSQLNKETRSNPLAFSDAANCLLVKSLFMLSAIDSVLKGLKYSTLPAHTSLKTGMSEHKTGKPEAIASSAGNPNPSEREGST